MPPAPGPSRAQHKVREQCNRLVPTTTDNPMQILNSSMPRTALRGGYSR
ncbi:hypothetical protein RGE_01060 [Rubrivivax gelatinosus IL144]|uniref:Uncharacterized protein n=1 Tax=Rubrivivax gelatinosus (strain NBRC 100245 / IL144) TaxID=983917 RepID=I0HKB4_RUBGI|nr:hypothetical protein RGE_01060 [Rubrivivax gelatinosus IL144]